MPYHTMCTRVPCNKGDKCTYAHSEKEQTRWNQEARKSIRDAAGTMQEQKKLNGKIGAASNMRQVLVVIEVCDRALTLCCSRAYVRLAKCSYAVPT
jgi:hypothetical protein